MNKQPAALRLADALIERHGVESFEGDAAAELRRLHAENERLHQINQSHEMKLSVRGYEIQIADLAAQRDALLEALKKAEENGCATVYSNEYDECGVKGCCGVVSYKPHADDCWVTTARAAIKAVEETK